MKEKLKVLGIGAFVLAFLMILGWMLLYLKPSYGNRGLKLRVAFQSIEKIAIGTRVTFAGRIVGEVTDISEIPDARILAATRDDILYFYELQLTVDDSVKIYASDDIGIQTAGLLGERSIGIRPRRPSDPKKNRLINDELILATAGDRMEELVDQMGSLAKEANAFITQVKQVIQDNRDEIKLSVDALRMTAQAAHAAMDNLAESDTFTQMGQAVRSIDHVATLLAEQLHELQQEGTVTAIASSMRHIESITASLNQPEAIKASIEHLATLTKSASETFTSVNSAMDGLRTKQGTVYKLLSDDGVYVQMASALQKMNGVMDDINQYGVLFQNNKDWQRERAKRFAEIHRLNDPEAFRTYFAEQMTTLSSDVTQLSESYQQAAAANSAIASSPEFREALREVHARMKSLETVLGDLLEKEAAI